MSIEIFWIGFFIFFARIGDVTLGTIRTICTVNEKKFLAASIGFVEVFIWFTAVRSVINSAFAGKMFVAFCFALGYACGKFLGIFLSDKIFKNPVEVRIILSDDSGVIPQKLRESGFVLSTQSSFGKDFAKKEVVFLITQTRFVKRILNIVNNFDEKAFITIDRVRNIYKKDSVS